MKSILLRELKSFFGSLTGYLVIAFFLILNGLFLFVLEGSYNILKSGFSDVTAFFNLAPWILVFLIPAITMKSFSEELKQGTIELLLTKPLSIWEIVLGKFGGAFVLGCLAVLPTLFYMWIVSNYTLGGAALDYGSIAGSYIGLLFLLAAYTSIGLFCSVITENQIVAFIAAVMVCLFLFVGLDAFANALGTVSFSIEKWGMDYHYKSLSRGVIDTRDILYFCSVSLVFLGASVYTLKSFKK